MFRMGMAGVVVGMAVMGLIRLILAVFIRADPLHMMMVAFLRQAVMGFEADDLFAVFAKLAIHIVLAAQNTTHPFLESIDYADLIA